jgi:hypothetical protein
MDCTDDDDNSNSTCHGTDDGVLPRDAEDCCRSDDENDEDYSVMEDKDDSLTGDEISGSSEEEFTTTSCSSDEDDELGEGERDGDNRTVRDLVEPASRPILKALIREKKNGIPAPAMHLYREWQLHGKSAIADGNGADDDGARFRRTEELLVLCTRKKKAKSNKKRKVCCDGGRVSVDPARSSGGSSSSSISQQESAGTRLVAFLCNDLPKTSVLWLTHRTFLVGTGPATPDRNGSDQSSWCDCWKDFALDVEWSVTLDGGATYTFQLYGSHHAARSHRRNGADLWGPLLLTIFARASDVRAIRCTRPGAHARRGARLRLGDGDPVHHRSNGASARASPPTRGPRRHIAELIGASGRAVRKAAQQARFRSPRSQGRDFVVLRRSPPDTTTLRTFACLHGHPAVGVGAAYLRVSCLVGCVA